MDAIKINTIKILLAKALRNEVNYNYMSRYLGLPEEQIKTICDDCKSHYSKSREYCSCELTRKDWAINKYTDVIIAALEARDN